MANSTLTGTVTGTQGQGFFSKIADVFRKGRTATFPVQTPEGQQEAQFRLPPPGLQFLASFLTGIGSLQAQAQQEQQRQAVITRELQRQQQEREFQFQVGQTQLRNELLKDQMKLQKEESKRRLEAIKLNAMEAVAAGTIVPATSRRLGTSPIIGPLQRSPETAEIGGQAFRPTTPTERFGIRRQQLETEASAQIQAKINAAQAFAKQFGFKEGSPEFNQSVGRALGVQPLTQLKEVAKSVGMQLPESLGNVLIESDEAVKMLLQFQRMDTAEQKAAITQANKLRVDRRQELQRIGWFEVSSFGQNIESVMQKAGNKAENVSGQGQITILFSFAKVLEPTSVFREGEQTAFKATDPLLQRVLNSYNRVVAGKFLSPQTLMNFVEEARSIFSSKKRTKQEIDTFYNRLARDAGISPDLVIRPEPQDIPPRPSPEHKLQVNELTGEVRWVLAPKTLKR